jgi:WD40 repeat protein
LLATIEQSSPPRIAVWSVLQGQAIWQSSDVRDLDSVFLIPTGEYLATIRRDPFSPQANLTLLNLSTRQPDGANALSGAPSDWQSFSPDGRWMASVRYLDGDPMFAVLGTSGNVLARTELVLFRLPSCEEYRSIACKSTPQTSCFSPDSQLVAIGHRDGTIKLCHVESGEDLFAARIDSAEIRQLAFSGDGATLVISSGEGNIRFLQLDQLRESLREINLAW